jgi:hypothetical protein
MTLPTSARFHLAFVAAAVLALLAAPRADAHDSALSQLRLRVEGAAIHGEWEIHLKDIRVGLGLDPEVKTDAGWQEVVARDSTLRAWLSRQLTITSDGAACPLTLEPAPIEWERDKDYVLVHLSAACPAEPRTLGLGYELLFDLDPRHRGFFSVEDARVTHLGVFKEHERSVAFDVRHFRAGAAFLEFVGEGIGHIWGGFDHLLFLVALLLPAALTRVGGGWTPRAGFWPTAREVVKVVTAFTLAHSLTLVLSFFGVVRLPSMWVESAIALSVFAAAWNNLRPFLPGRAWMMALGFGLIHGLGFAGALSGLALPRQARGLALGAFNLGVEAGQLAIVAVALPLLFAASRRGWYPRWVMGLGSLGIAWIAVVWFLERVSGESLL